MNEHEQRIAIAEACGWTLCVFVESINLAKGFPLPNSPLSYGTYENGMAQLPNYLNDLNAMNEAEKVLYGNPNLPKKYTQQIKNAICREAGVTKAQMNLDVCITATAAQRAEAFLRTIGKWTKINSIKESP